MADLDLGYSLEHRKAAELCELCRRGRFSITRFVLLTTLALGTAASLIALDALSDRPYGVQEASIFIYSLSVLWFTFGRMKHEPRPFMFTCPAVRSQFPRLIQRHFAFLLALVALQTAALALRPHLPAWWNREIHDGRHTHIPFDDALGFVCIVLLFIQVGTNRSLLDRAHRRV